MGNACKWCRERGSRDIIFIYIWVFLRDGSEG